jgi:putative oxidoreductase
MMKIVRSIARPMLAGVFIAGGMDVLRNPEPRANVVKPVVEKIAAVVSFAPSDPTTAVKLNAMVHVGAGGMLAAGILPRLAALALATSMVPTTLAGHGFWEVEDPAQRARQRTQFLKNTAILGGLLVVALD